MPRFFLSNISGETVHIEGDDAWHIAKALHAKPGREFVVSDAKGIDYLCVVRQTQGSVVTLNVLSSAPCPNEPKAYIRLYQALPKGDKLELIIQKAVELGASEIIPVLTSRCIARPSYKAMDKKLTRLQRIAYEAAKQCDRGIIPKVMPLLEFDKAVIQMAESDLAILFYEESQTPLRQFLTSQPASISVMVGSEGGFSHTEAAFAQNRGIAAASLGGRTLRCETAPITALSVILYHLGEF